MVNIETTNIPEILDVEDLTELLRVSKQTIRNLIKRQEMPGWRYASGKYVCTKKQLLEWIENNKWNFGKEV